MLLAESKWQYSGISREEAYLCAFYEVPLDEVHMLPLI